VADERPVLSLILPVFRGAGWIEGNVRTVLRCLDELPGGFELLVVCDGDDDLASEAAYRVAGDDQRVRVFRYPQNQGKGFAISFGIGQAHGALIGWLDADLDIDPEVIVRAVHRFTQSPVDAVVGSKRHEEASVNYPLIRRVYSWGYQMLVRVLFRLDVRDTQVGAKVFRREMLATVTPLLLVKRYAFDLEVLAVGAEFGFDRVVEVPVNLDYRFSGTSIDLGAIRNMLLDTLAIGYRLHVRHWYARRFAEVRRVRAANAEPESFVEVGR
jgi:glycosyltransferase involved in cell wall biosynthesis